MAVGAARAAGYGAQHKRLRRSWVPRVEAGEVACWRCGAPILPGSEWDLGHADHDRSIYMGPEHASCNRSAGARQGRPSRQPRQPERREPRYQTIDGEDVLLPPGITRWSRKWRDVDLSEYGAVA